jgi:hypothetical protein
MARPRKRYYVDDGYYDPQLAAIGAAGAAIPVIKKVGEKVYETGRGTAEFLTAGLRRPPPQYLVRRDGNGYAKLAPWIRIGILAVLWLLGIYLIRKLLQNWVLGGLAWIAGVGVDFALEKKTHTPEELAKLPAGTPAEYTDFTQVLKNSFLNPLALLWTVVFVLMLMNALPEVRYE